MFSKITSLFFKTPASSSPSMQTLNSTDKDVRTSASNVFNKTKTTETNKKITASMEPPTNAKIPGLFQQSRAEKTHFMSSPPQQTQIISIPRNIEKEKLQETTQTLTPEEKQAWHDARAHLNNFKELATHFPGFAPQYAKGIQSLLSCFPLESTEYKECNQLLQEIKAAAAKNKSTVKNPLEHPTDPKAQISTADPEKMLGIIKKLINDFPWIASDCASTIKAIKDANKDNENIQKTCADMPPTTRL